MTTLLIATRNAHKVREISDMFGTGFRCMALNDFPGAPAAVEDAETFAGNATKKARCLAEWLTKNPKLIPAGSFYVVADDSGLEVDTLNGAPGVHSARFAAADTVSGNSPDADNNARLVRLLIDTPADKRTARFRCVLAVIAPNDPVAGVALFDGTCKGRISAGAAGGGGFGYDPLFVPDGFSQSFAELGDEAKNRISHRARALEKLKQWLAR
jgi:XTP/dITP diphosphohydrolase